MIVGKNFSRQGGCRLDASFPFLIEIGDNVGLSTEVTILTHDNSLKRHIGVLKLGKVTIGNNVFIGAKSLILPNVHIGNNVVIGAGSVVSRNIPDNSVVAGNPARIIRSTTQYVDKFKEQLLSHPILDHSYSPLHLNNTKKEFIKQLCENGFSYVMCENYERINTESKK